MEIKGGAGYPKGCSCPRGCSCLQGVQLSPGGAVVSTAPTFLKTHTSWSVQLRQLHPLRGHPLTKKIPAVPKDHEETPLWALTDSNRRPSACKADALNQLS